MTLYTIQYRSEVEIFGKPKCERRPRLLRHEAAGHSSKAICATLNVEATAIDCRFQRLNTKLDAPDRRTSLRIARLYGLL